MKRTKLPKLALHTATIVVLDTARLKQIAGGGGHPTISSPTTCGDQR